MKGTSIYIFNMFIMNRELVDRYCTWLFDILEELENVLDISAYSKNDQRVFGFVGERLLDVWLETGQFRYRNIPYIFLENQNWLKKVYQFIRRKMKANRQ